MIATRSPKKREPESPTPSPATPQAPAQAVDTTAAERRERRIAERADQGLDAAITAPAGLRRLALLLRDAERRARR